MPALDILSQNPLFRHAVTELVEPLAGEEKVTIVDGNTETYIPSGPVVWIGPPPSQPLAAHQRHLPTPFRYRDFTLCLRAAAQFAMQEERLRLADGWFSLRERKLQSPDGLEVLLTEKEAELLAWLLQAGAEGASREAALDAVWGYAPGLDTHTLETHIYRLRAKLREAFGERGERMIVTTAEGYALDKG